MVLFIKNYISSLKSASRFKPGRYAGLKVGLVADALTQASMEKECCVKNITPSNFVDVLNGWRPDLIFVESAWQGFRDSWKYRIASYSDYPERHNESLQAMLRAARTHGIPALFWNKEDDVHYYRFESSAKLFEYIYTVDANCIAKYRVAAPNAKVDSLMFPVQARFHYAKSQAEKSLGFSSFVGSYGTHVHPRRREWQDLLFDAFAPHGLDVYDRNSSRRAAHYRYPDLPGLRVRSKVGYESTAHLYRRYKFNLNVNTIETSPTMYSRRLIEILAVAGVAVTTPAEAVTRLFSDYCQIVDCREDLDRILHWSDAEYSLAREKARAGAEYVACTHTWTHRLSQIENDGVF
jgi:hypothetical protein